VTNLHVPRVFAVKTSSSARSSVDDGETIRGVRVSRRSFAESAGLLTAWVGQRDRMRYFACLNAHSAEVAHRDATFMAALQQADLLVADGFGVILASRILGGRIRERATGPDLFLAVSEALDRAGDRSVFYLGGSEEMLARIHARHEKRFPNLRVAGMYAPPFRSAFAEDELAAMVDRVNDARPDVLWIGLGAPKQEKWILAARDRLRVPLCGPVGAVFDYFAGNVAPPPRWVEKAGLHWAYRLARNPRRLWRRNLDSPLFLARVLADRLRGGRRDATAAPPRSTS
jgi:N-acetylglucosaminyldiphosphoundecaprenol N-acetyl-beta-D-mannosaminyltransferase